MAEWENILPKMEQLIRERGLAPLGESEREAIIRYRPTRKVIGLQREDSGHMAKTLPFLGDSD
jgi:hypothetical protein